MEKSQRAEESAENSEETTAEPTTVPPLKRSDGVHIYDNAEIFSKEDFEELNGYAEYLSGNYSIDTAVVTESDLDGQSPDEFAEKRYNELYNGSENGMLLLINNDTKVDFLYKKGICGEVISEDDEKNAFYTATREIVDGDYKSAVMRILRLAESCESGGAEISTEEA